MNTNEMIKIIDMMGISQNYYSINGSLGSDKCIFRKVHNYWECFYMDERGGQNNAYSRFANENDACNYFLEMLKTTLI